MSFLRRYAVTSLLLALTSAGSDAARPLPRTATIKGYGLCTRFCLRFRQGFEKAYQPRLRRHLRQSRIAPRGPGRQWHDLSAYLQGAARHRAERTPSAVRRTKGFHNWQGAYQGRLARSDY